MIIKDKTFVHHYSPESRDKRGTTRTIIFRNADSPYMRCKHEVDVIYDKVRRLLTTADIWLEYSLNEDITREAVQTLEISINKILVVATGEIEELISTHGVTDRDDVFEIKDVVTQLQEIAEDIFKQHTMQ